MHTEPATEKVLPNRALDHTYVEEPLLSARPIELWGNPDSKTFVRDYLVYVTFLNCRFPWHKWAVIPLMHVQERILQSGTYYRFYDLQSYNNRYIAGTHIKSNHAWALAVDVNPRENPMRYDNVLITDIPVPVRDAFKAEGFKWGGDYRTVKDTMHFEYLGLPVKEEEEDVNDTQDKLIKLNRVSLVARSYDVNIVTAMMKGDMQAEATWRTKQAEAVDAERKRLGLTLGDVKEAI